MEPSAQSYFSGSSGNAAKRNLEKHQQALNNGLEPIAGLVAKFNNSILEVSAPDQTQPFKRLKLDLPPGWMATTDISDRKPKIVGLNFSTNHESPYTRQADASQPHEQPDIEMIPCDSPIEPGSIDFAKSEIFQCRSNCLEFKLKANFGCYILDASLSPTSKNLLISGCDTLRDHILRTWQQDANGNWSQNGSIGGSQKIFCQLNRAEDKLLSLCDDGNVKVSTLNNDGCWEEVVALAHTPLEKGYPPLTANFSPLQDKIVSFDPRNLKTNILRLDSNGRWTPLHQPEEISYSFRSLEKKSPFKITNNYLLTCKDRSATIWDCSDESNCLVEKEVMHSNGEIEDAHLSNDERHALIRDIDKNVKIFGYDNNGDWVGKKTISDCNYAAFSPSGRKLLAYLGRGAFKLCNCNSNDDTLDKDQFFRHIGSDTAIFSPSENFLLSYGNQTSDVCIWGDDGEGNLINKAWIRHQGAINNAAFNDQEDSVLTSSLNDNTVKIQSLDSQGQWQEQLVVQLKSRVDHSRFSLSGRLASALGFTTDTESYILWRDDDGKWKKHTVTIPDGYVIRGAEFNRADNHFLTYGSKDIQKDHHKPGFVQLWGRGDDGKWIDEELITLDHHVRRANFSPDGDYLIIHCADDLTCVIPKGSTVLLWKIPARETTLNSP
ncbi:WD40 repeat domain-containing protein [Thalassotalea sp. G20_0]|uniref:WD40 repeat domain-containing protein n=1 Tax=Thalassotalea sp. G20_0 TaxID=2821093 RepID=UPI001ADA709D|nr:WD40 repeat domain-containing protein [Thalassotalea sp. G20_0]MBO9495072.1 WD40 repeat domain-containing protein [Thalassotalea sp. G20_0]